MAIRVECGLPAYVDQGGRRKGAQALLQFVGGDGPCVTSQFRPQFRLIHAHWIASCRGEGDNEAELGRRRAIDAAGRLREGPCDSS
jgi:hypothetical protein